MTGRKFSINTKTEDIEVMWPQEEIRNRFEGFSSDLAELMNELYTKADRYPLEFRGVYLAGIKDTLIIVQASLEDRFDELNRTGLTGHSAQKNNNDDDKIDLGELK